jgi:hypothetical protein
MASSYIRLTAIRRGANVSARFNGAANGGHRRVQCLSFSEIQKHSGVDHDRGCEHGFLSLGLVGTSKEQYAPLRGSDNLDGGPSRSLFRGCRRFGNVYIPGKSKAGGARERDQKLDQRARQDDLLRSILSDTLAWFNRVKRTRRLLKAHTGSPSGGRVTVDVYDTHMSVLIEGQLQFEWFKRVAPFTILDERLSPAQRSALVRNYGSIETYLNHIVGEYEKCRHLVAGDTEGRSVDSLEGLKGFMGKTFKTGVSPHIRDLIDILQPAILKPMAVGAGFGEGLNERELRQLRLMDERLQAFVQDKSTIGPTTADLRGLVSTLEETPEEWRENFIKACGELEDADTEALDQEYPPPNATDPTIRKTVERMIEMVGTQIASSA